MEPLDSVKALLTLFLCSNAQFSCCAAIIRLFIWIKFSLEVSAELYKENGDT